MKKSKGHRIAALALGVTLLSGVTFHALAFDRSNIIDTGEEEVILIMDHQVENLPPDAKHVYLYPDGIGGYIPVSEEADAGFTQEEIAVEAADEVYLTRVQVSETLYEYLDEAGTMVVAMELLDEPPTTLPRAATKYGFSWRLTPGAYTHGNVDLDVANGEQRLYVSMMNTNKVPTYIGFYSTGSNQYYWIEPPSSADLSNVYFTVASSHPVNFALRNNSQFTNQYTGQYWITPN